MKRCCAWAVAVFVLLTAGLSVEVADASESAPVAVSFDLEIRQGDLIVASPNMVVSAGEKGLMELPGKFGSVYRVEAEPRLVRRFGDQDVAYVRVRLSEREGSDWKVIAQPELLGALGEGASVDVTGLASDHRRTTGLRVAIQAAGSATMLPPAARRAGPLSARTEMRQCIPCGDVQLCCTNGCCSSECGQVCDGRP